MWRHSAAEPGGQHAAPSGAPGGLPMGHGGPPQGAQAAQLGQHAAALLAAYGTCAPESAAVRRRLCLAAGSSACCCAGDVWGVCLVPARPQHLLTGGRKRTAAGKAVLRAARRGLFQDQKVCSFSILEPMTVLLRQAVAPAQMPTSLQELQALMRRSLAVEPQARRKCFSSCQCMSGCMLACSVSFACSPALVAPIARS